ncbi:MAG TPA: ABC transporter substrate-binding protein [Pseudolabrys sp.]|nr:ABC transporter substrate-binding protein [Pseudolabrys sp.]
MNRRTSLQLCPAALMWPGWLAAQPARRFRVGCLWVTNETAVKPFRDAFLAGMREYGYVAGRNLALDERYAEGDVSRLPVLADELITLKPDVLIGIESAVAVLRRRTTTIPLVLIAGVNPVAAGLMQSLSRPGTNVTGLSFRQDELIAKHIELLAEINPRITRIALFQFAAVADEPWASIAALYEQYARKAASAKGLTLVIVTARDAQGVRRAFERLGEEQAEGLVVAASGFTWQLRNEIIRETRRLKIPSITSNPQEWADSGGLATYGPSFLHNYRRVATYVDRIFKGAKPAELPIEEMAKFEFVVDLRTAREIGVTIPQVLLFRADRVIE